MDSELRISCKYCSLFEVESDFQVNIVLQIQKDLNRFVPMTIQDHTKKLHNNAMFPLIIFNSIYVFPWPRRHILAKRQKVVQYTIVNTPKKFKSILILIHALLHNRFVTLYLEDLAFCLIL